MGNCRCKKCEYLLRGEEISLVSRMAGYSVECSKTGTLFNLESIETEPLWCPLISDSKRKADLKLSS